MAVIISSVGGGPDPGGGNIGKRRSINFSQTLHKKDISLQQTDAVCQLDVCQQPIYLTEVLQQTNEVELHEVSHQ